MKKKKLKDISKKIVITDIPEVNIRILGKGVILRGSENKSLNIHNKKLSHKLSEGYNF